MSNALRLLTQSRLVRRIENYLKKCREVDLNITSDRLQYLTGILTEVDGEETDWRQFIQSKS